MPRQPIPPYVPPIEKFAHVISPSLSSASADDEEVDEDQDNRFARARHAISPSPEVDLSSPDLDESDPDQPPNTPGASFAARSSLSRDQSVLTHSNRATSPPLEHVERDFTRMVNQLQEEAEARRNSEHDIDMDNILAESKIPSISTITMSIEPNENEESVALFGNSRFAASNVYPAQMEFSSPVIRPLSSNGMQLASLSDLRDNTSTEQMLLDLRKDFPAFPEIDLLWDDQLQSLQCPESVELDELETMFDAY